MRLGRPLVVFALVLASALLVSWSRLRELALADAPLSLWVPFARPLLSASFEMALIVGVPAAVLSGWAAGLLLRRAILLALVLIAISAVGAVGFDRADVAPGRLAQELIEAARSSCAKTRERRVAIPLLAAAWVCTPGEKSRVTGSVPGVPLARFRAASLTVSDDLHRIALQGFELEVPSVGERPALRLAARSATFRGLAPWGRPSNVPLAVRIFAALLQAGATLVVGLTICRWLTLGFPLALVLGLGAGLAALLVQRLIDRLGTGVTGQLLAIPVGALVVVLLTAAGLASRSLYRRVARRGAGW